MADTSHQAMHQEASPRWRQLVGLANAEFRIGRVRRSVRLYARAASLLDTELEGRTMTAALLLAKVITLQNWAAALACLGDVAGAGQLYARCYALACAIALDSHETPQLRAVAMRQCAMTKQEWAACRGDDEPGGAYAVH